MPCFSISICAMTLVIKPNCLRRICNYLPLEERTQTSHLGCFHCSVRGWGFSFHLPDEAMRISVEVKYHNYLTDTTYFKWFYSNDERVKNTNSPVYIVHSAPPVSGSLRSTAAVLVPKIMLQITNINFLELLICVNSVFNPTGILVMKERIQSDQTFERWNKPEFWGAGGALRLNSLHLSAFLSLILHIRVYSAAGWGGKAPIE